MKHTITLLIMALVVGACMSQSQEQDEQSSECSTFGNDSRRCHWQIENRLASLCCPGTAPYCGMANTNCGVGKCCPSPPLDMTLRPLG